MNLPFLRSPHNYDMMVASDEAGLACADGSLTHQSFKDDADINVIVERFGIGQPVASGAEVPTFDDFSSVVDYHTAMNLVARANEAFDGLPANVRSRFHNDPGRFIDYINEPGHEAELVSLGLARAPEAVSGEHAIVQGGAEVSPPAVP